MAGERDIINEILKNIHGSLKWYWQVVMGLAMVKAIDTLYDSIFVKGTFLWGNFAIPLFFLGFLPTFLRLYFGDSRYLDEHYIEYRKWRSDDEFFEDTKVKITAKRFKLDITLLMVIGILIVFMAKSLSRPKIFFAAYFALLVFDVVWISLTNPKPTPTPDKIELQERYKAPYIWRKNNFIHASIMLASGLLWVRFDKPLDTLVLILFVGLSISNSLFDILLTNKFYFPPLNTDHAKRLKSPKIENDYSST
jgi:hypothetical protein